MGHGGVVIVIGALLASACNSTRSFEREGPPQASGEQGSTFTLACMGREACAWEAHGDGLSQLFPDQRCHTAQERCTLLQRPRSGLLSARPATTLLGPTDEHEDLDVLGYDPVGQRLLHVTWGPADERRGRLGAVHTLESGRAGQQAPVPEAMRGVLTGSDEPQLVLGGRALFRWRNASDERAPVREFQLWDLATDTVVDGALPVAAGPRGDHVDDRGAAVCSASEGSAGDGVWLRSSLDFAALLAVPTTPAITTRHGAESSASAYELKRCAGEATNLRPPPVGAPPPVAVVDDAPPPDALPTDALPTDALPTDALPTDALPTDAPPTDAPPSHVQDDDDDNVFATVLFGATGAFVGGSGAGIALVSTLLTARDDSGCRGADCDGYDIATLVLVGPAILVGTAAGAVVGAVLGVWASGGDDDADDDDLASDE